MAGAIAAGCFSISSAPPVTVQLHNQEIDALAFNAAATAAYTVGSNGAVSASPGGLLETWLTGTGASASNYEVMASQSAGPVVSGTMGVWLNCGSSPTWSLTNSRRDNSVFNDVLAVQIRDVATQTVQASASITLSAESDSRFG